MKSSNGCALGVVTALTLLSLLSGCVSTHMKVFVGKDIREVMMIEGPPINAFDLGEGRRAFQYRFGGGKFALPQTSNTTGTATVIGNSVWLDQRTITQPATVVESEGCLISYIAEYSATKSNWTVVDIRYPKRLVC
jgi:hypothetical protein